jgi:FKBP-type peptidyl-prolyl cis-trans isomerase SlyD
MAETIPPSRYTIQDSSGYVKISYMVKVAGGRVLKGAGQPEIMDFVTGYRQVVPGLEKRLLGHAQGERLAFTIPPEEAFGPRYDELVIEKDKADFHFPPGMEPWVGMELPMIANDEEAPDSVVIRSITDKTIVIDANHPLAGASLEYDLEIVEARPATQSDVCSEWETEKSDGCAACSGAPHEIVLGIQDDAERN